LVARTELGKVLMLLAPAWFIFWAFMGPAGASGLRAAFWSAFAIWASGFLLWLYGEAGVPRLSDAMAEELEGRMRFRVLPRVSLGRKAKPRGDVQGKREG